MVSEISRLLLTGGTGVVMNKSFQIPVTELGICHT